MVDPKRESQVWERVMAHASVDVCAPQQDTLTPEQVTELLTEELKVAYTYEALARRMRGQAVQQLRWLAGQERQHCRQLQTIYYLLTGTKPCPDKPKPPCIARTDEALRSCYMEQVRGAERYLSLSGKAGSFGKLFCRLADEEERHANEVLKILQQCL